MLGPGGERLAVPCFLGPPPSELRQDRNNAHHWEVQVVDVLPPLLFRDILPMRPSPEGTMFLYITFCPLEIIMIHVRVFTPKKKYVTLASKFLIV